MFKDFLKPLKKRDAQIAALLFGAVLLILVYNLIKDLLSGMTFEEVRSNILMIVFFGIIEWGMVVIGTSKDKDENAASEDSSPKAGEMLPEESAEEEDPEEYTEGLSEEFGEEDADDADGSEDAGADGSEAG